MLSETPVPRRALATWVRRWWAAHDREALTIAIGLMGIAAVVWLAYELWRLVWQTGEWGAVDLRLIQGWVKAWFSPEPPIGLFPPASYPMLWPLMGWLPFGTTRWLWAVTTIGALWWLCSLSVRHSLADSPLERAVVILMPLAIYPTGAAIGNGQLVVHLMPVLLTGLLLLDRRHAHTWRQEMLAAIFMLLALVKPTISAPFFWIVLFVPRSLRPASLAALAYAALTWFAMAFKDQDVITVLRSWMRRSSAAAALQGQGNVSNVNIWLEGLGRREWILPVSLLILAALGPWVYRHRRGDLWLLIGVTGYVSRLWTYHRWYEDLLVLPAMIALFRLAKRASGTSDADLNAGVVLALTLVFMVAPGGLFVLPPPLNTVYVAGQLAVWGLGLIVLVAAAERAKALEG